MNLKFDSFRNMEMPNFYLCNPDKKMLSIIHAIQPELTLRYNDLSELSFKVPSRVSSQTGQEIDTPYFESVATKRLVFVDGVGYFQISEVSEVQDGLFSQKDVVATSLQCVLRDRGVIIQDKVYKFYNPDDPFDAAYNALEDQSEAIPSVVGQLCRQLGIWQSFDDNWTKIEPDSKWVDGGYTNWTITHIDKDLFYNEDEGTVVCRSFSESTTEDAYNFITQNVENTFDVVVLFDFNKLTISINTIDSIRENKSNIYLSFNNVMTELQTTESADDVITVLNCSGTNTDIRALNPTGTNYIVDFSYYMSNGGGSTNGKSSWMSAELSNKLREWQELVDEETESQEPGHWRDLVRRLKEKYKEKAQYEENRVYLDLKLKNIFDTRDALIKGVITEELTGDELVLAEKVEDGSFSLDPHSAFSEAMQVFSKDIQWTCFNGELEPYVPVKEGDVTFFRFVKSEDPKNYAEGTFDENYRQSDTWTIDNEPIEPFAFFADGDEYASGKYKSYCMLYGAAQVTPNEEDPRSPSVEYHVGGFDRYILYSGIPEWTEYYESKLAVLDAKIGECQSVIDEISSAMQVISNRLNILSYFSDSEELTSELKSYWIEGEYINDGITIHDTTTEDEVVELTEELLAASKRQLAQSSQPRFVIKVSAINFPRIPQFLAFANELELGKIITIEKNTEGADRHYEPMLTSMSFSLEDASNFSLEFSNTTRPSEDWSIADLLGKSASTSKKVSGNWQDLTSYSKDKTDIESKINNPLDRALRIAENPSNQEFIIDSTGVLGRMKLETEDSAGVFSPEQLRMINNLLVFTDDNWRSVKTALGKIVYENPEWVAGNPPEEQYIQAYGLAAEALIGKVIMGESLFIQNAEGNITLDAKGITITKDGEATFLADRDGNVSMSGTILAKSGTIGGYTIGEKSLVNGTVGMSSDDTPGALSLWAGIQEGQYTATLEITAGWNGSISVVVSGEKELIREEVFEVYLLCYNSMGSLFSTTVNVAVPNINTPVSYYVDSDVRLSTCHFNDGSGREKNFTQSLVPFTVSNEGYLITERGRVGDLTLEKLGGQAGSRLVSHDGLFEINTASDGTAYLAFYDGQNIVSQINHHGVVANRIHGVNELVGGEIQISGAKIALSSTSSNAPYIALANTQEANNITATAMLGLLDSYEAIVYLNKPSATNLDFQVSARYLNNQFQPVVVNRTVRVIAGNTSGSELLPTPGRAYLDIVFTETGLSIMTVGESNPSQEIKFCGTLIPTEDNNFSLGTAENRWKRLYVEEIYFKGKTVYVNEEDSVLKVSQVLT